jgi:hypothetical protein
MPSASVSVERGYDSSRKAAFLIKVATVTYEVNVWIPVRKIKKLRDVPQTRWLGRALRLGRSAGSDVFWCCDDNKVGILIGRDDETWDVGITISLSTFQRILREIEACA